jgi:hypothetical protein
VVPPSLTSAVGAAVQCVRRVHYVFNGRPDTDFGPVELTIGERVFLFDNAPDGESLRIIEHAWHDPFREPLSEENREFVERSGKWTAFDVSTLGPWAKLIGEPLADVEPITNEDGKTTGILLRTTHGGLIRLGVMADELFLDELVAPE